MTLPPRRVMILCGIYVALHVLSHVTASWFAVGELVDTSIWYPPVGLALSLLILLGPRYFWVVLATNLGFNLIQSGDPWNWGTWFFPLLLSAVYATTAALVRRYVGPVLLPGNWRSTLAFCLVVAGAPFVAGVIGAVVASGAIGAMGEEGFWTSMFGWWLGDAAGLLTVVPAAMVFLPPWLEGRVSIPPLREWQAGAILMALGRGLLLAGSVVFVLLVPALSDHDGFYLCFLPLVWICFRHALPGATLATLVVMMTGLVGMRLTGSTIDFAYSFLLFAVAVAGVGLGLGTLVSRRRLAEQKLADSEAQLDRVIEGAQLGLWEWDLGQGAPTTNRRLARILGYAPEEMEQQAGGWAELIHPDDREWQQAAMSAHLRGDNELYEVEYRMRTAEGDWRWIQSRGSVVQRGADGQPVRVSGTHADVSARKEAEAEIGRLLKIVESTPDLIFTADSDGRALYANHSMITWWGGVGAEARWQGLAMEHLDLGEVGKTLQKDALPAALATGTWHGEGQISNERGQSIYVSVLALAHHDELRNTSSLSFIMRDVSGQKKAEAERLDQQRAQLKAQQNESLGVLAGGIAHDFNNLMTGVMGNASLVRSVLNEDSEPVEWVGQIEGAAKRAAELCQQMLAYAGRNPIETAEVDLNPLVLNTVNLFRPSLDKRIKVSFEPDPHPRKVMVAGTQLQQVVMNLLLNAADAIEAGEGHIRLKCTHRKIDPATDAERFPRQDLPKGDCVFLEVSDDGSGMSEETRERIFEPFFTTKFTGQGLGLAAVSGFVRSHGGAVGVESAMGEGTSFYVAIPAVEEVAEAPVDVVAVPPKKPAGTWKGSGNILVVDDDTVVMLVTKRLCESMGFNVIEAVDGVEGVEKFAEHKTDLQAVLLDLTMPRKDGFTAHAEMHEINPDVPVILISGYAQKLAELPPSAIHPAGVLPKPFGRKQLMERLRAALGA